MLKNKITRHTFTFLMIALASTLLFPASNTSSSPIIWALLVVVIIANLINLLIT